MTNDDPAPSSDTGPQPVACDIQLQNPCRYSEAGARVVRPWLTPLLHALAPTARSFGIRFVSDREMRRINRTFRDKDSTTDVLSFPGDLAADAADPWLASSEAGGHLGDVVLAVPTARRQAAAAGHETHREVQILLLHGVLHCLGHDHETDDGEMEALETRLRQRFVDPPANRSEGRS